MSIGYGSIYTLLAEIRDELGFSESQLGWVVGVGFFAGFVTQIGLARFADRGYSAVMVRTGVILAAIGMLNLIVADQLWQFIVSRAVLGFGSGMVGPAIRRIVISHDPTNIGENLGRQGAFDIGGFVIGPLLAAAGKELFNFRAPFVIMAAMYGAVLLLAITLDLDASPAPAQKRVLRGLLEQRSIRAALCASIAFYITIGMYEAVWALLLKDLGASTWLVGLTLSLFTVPMIFLAPFGGRTAQRLGPLRVASGTILIATLCTTSYGFVPLWIALFISLAHAVADSFTMPANQVAVAIASPPEHIASGQGLLGAVGVAVAGIVGVASGAAYDSFGRETLFAGTGAAMAVFLVLAWLQGSSLRQPLVRPAVASAHET